MNGMQETEKDYEQKYVEDILDIKMNLEALYVVVETLLNVAKQQEADYDLISCLNIIAQSINGVMVDVNKKVDSYDNF